MGSSGCSETAERDLNDIIWFYEKLPRPPIYANCKCFLFLLAAAPALIKVNLYIRSVSRIDDVRMVSTTLILLSRISMVIELDRERHSLNTHAKKDRQSVSFYHDARRPAKRAT